MQTAGETTGADDARGGAAATVIAALAPVAGCVVTTLLLVSPVWRAPRGVQAVAILVAEAGATGLASVGLALVSMVACALWLGVAARRRRGVPLAPLLGLAGSPWLASSVGAWFATRAAEEAAHTAEPAVRATRVASGVAETLSGGALGASMSAGLLLGVAIGVTVGAIVQRAPSRYAHGALPGALALAAVAQVLDQLGRRDVFGMLAAAAPEQRAALFARGLLEGMTVHRVHAWSWVLVAIVAVGVAAWSWSRGRPSTRPLVGAFATVAVSALLLGTRTVAAAGALRPLGPMLEDAVPTRFAGIELPRSRATAALGEAIRVSLALPFTVRVEDGRVPLDGVESALASHAERLRTIASMNPRRSFRGELEIGADRRFEVAPVLDVLSAAGRAGFVRPRLVVSREHDRRLHQIELVPLDARPEGTLALRLEVGRAGIRVCGSGGCLARGCATVTETFGPTVVSVTELRTCLAEVRRQFPDERTATVAVARTLTYQRLVDVLDAVHDAIGDVRLTALDDAR